MPAEVVRPTSASDAALPVRRTIGKAAGAGEGKPKVKISKAVATKVQQLNDSGKLAEPLRLTAVAQQLAALSQADALAVLDGVLEDPAGLREPITWVREAAKALAEQAEGNDGDGLMMSDLPPPLPMPEEEWQAWYDNWSEKADFMALAPRLPEPSVDLSPEVERRLLEVRRKSLLGDSDRPEPLLALLGPAPALEVLADYEAAALSADSGAVASQPRVFIGDLASKVLEGDRGTKVALRLSRRIRWVNANLGLKVPIKLGSACAELAGLAEPAALAVLRKLVVGVLAARDFEDPTAWIAGTARRLLSEEPAPIAKPPVEEQVAEPEGAAEGAEEPMT